MESTLSGKTYARYLTQARSAGFIIRLHYLDLPSVEESWARILTRIQEDGHSVPKEALYRRFPR